MAYAKKGDYIRILDSNQAHWVMVGNAYKVTSSEEAGEFERCFNLEGGERTWYADTSHYTIIPFLPLDTGTHPDFTTFKVGDEVCRWRDVEGFEWDDIGMINLPPLGESFIVETIDLEAGDCGSKEPSFHNSELGWFPMRAFIQTIYYNQTITNRGTAALNTTDHGKSNQGRTIEVQRSTPSIITGQRTARGGVQGRGNAAVTRGRHSSHQAITGR